MVIELVERLDAAASELLAGVKRGDASSEELLVVLARTKAVRGKLDSVQAVAASSVAGTRSHGDGGAHVLAESAGMSRHDARSQIRTAKAVESMPKVREAVEDGRMSFANAKRLADAQDKTSAAAVDSDQDLLAKAEALPPDQFVKEAKRWTGRAPNGRRRLGVPPAAGPAGSADLERRRRHGASAWAIRSGDRAAHPQPAQQGGPPSA